MIVLSVWKNKNIDISNGVLVDFKLYKEKNNVGILLKPFGCKVMTICHQCKQAVLAVFHYFLEQAGADATP